jgi:hypothetical protein
MSNLTEIQRNQIERFDNEVASGYRLLSPSARERQVFAALSFVLLALLGVLVYVAAWSVDSWWDWFAAADAVLLFFGLAAWVYPKRRHI